MNYSRVNLTKHGTDITFHNRWITDTACQFTMRKLERRAKLNPWQFIWV